ncbi:MAG: efflux RND transporter periplasmic adaptor subunit [Planctomycetota bacterium]
MADSVNLDDLRIREDSSGRKGRGLLVLLLLLLVPGAFAAGWFLAPAKGRAGPGGGIAVRTVAVTVDGAKAAAHGGLSEGGWIEVPSYHPIFVTALTSGRVEELLVLEGTRVEKGQVVARLWARDLEDALRVAEAELAERKADLELFRAGYREEDVAKQRAEVARLREQVSLAEKILERTKQLVPTGAASREDLDRDASAAATAVASLRSAEEELRRLTSGFRKEEIAKAEAASKRAEAVRDLAKAQLEYVEVKSPADGVVLERYVTPGTFLSPANPRVVSLYDPTDLQVRVDVRQESAGSVAVGQKAEVSVAAVPGKTWRGEVIRVEPLADFKKNTLQVKIRLLETDPVLHPEMICRVQLLAGTEPADASDAPREIRIPLSVIREEGGKSYVYTVAGGRVRRTEVRLGASSGGTAVVLAGLEGGERVALSPEGLADGDEVTEVAK